MPRNARKKPTKKIAPRLANGHLRVGKYARVVAELPRYAGEEPDYQVKVDAIKQAIVNEEGFQRHASTLARMYAELRRGKVRRLNDEEVEAYIVALGEEGIEQLKKALYLRMTAIEQLLVDQYENEDTRSIKLVDGGSVAVQDEPYAQVQNRDAYQKWCIDQGLLSLMTVPWQTTNAMTKQRLLDGLPPPPGVNAFNRSKIVLRK